MRNFCVLTTINKPTKAIEVLYEKFGERLIVVGDGKTPIWNYRTATYLNPDMPPHNHYSRKMLGYLHAIRKGADLIYDTDDDNIPNKEWGLRFKETKASKSIGEGWFNAYEPMTKTAIWPRGFPLSKIKSSGQMFGEKEKVVSSIQQGLSDGEPDVDAIYRMVFSHKNEFKYERSIYLEKNTWCTINSQSTWWFPEAYAFLYLPINCTFRCTDIYRGLVAQRCLWTLGQGVTFHSPSEVFQDRNEHDLMKDFIDEVPMYLNVEKIAILLQGLQLEGSPTDNLITCYQELIKHDIFPAEEIISVRAWVKDFNSVYGK